MLIIIDKSFEALIEHLCANGSIAQLRGLTNLLQSHSNGAHIVVIPPAICRILESSARLSEEHRSTATKIRAKFSELGALRDLLAVYGELTFLPGSPRLVNKVWSIPIEWIAQHGIDATNLICEDLYDCALSEEAARDFLNCSQLFKLKLTLDHIPGGGGNTHRVFNDRAVVRQKVSLCVVDSDRSEPSISASFGATAARCKSVAGSGMYELLCTVGRELENHLPSRLVDRIRPLWQGQIPSETYRSLDRGASGVSSFADLKSGLKKYEVDAMSGQQLTYWTTAIGQLPHCTTVPCCDPKCRAPASGDCKKSVIQPLGRTLLRDAKDYLEHRDRSLQTRHDAYLPSPNDAFWREMGRTVAAYGVGMKVARGM